MADAFLVVWRRLDDLPTEHGDARAWIFGMARQCLLNDRRGERRRVALAVRVADTGAPTSPDPDPDLLSRRLDLATAWPRLTAADQETIALTAWDGLTGPEASAVLGISPVAYRLRLSRARRALRRHLDLVPTTPRPLPALTEGSPS